MTFASTDPQTLATKIIEAAATIIETKGIKAATMRNIAQEAEVIPAQIYAHVGNLDQLLDAVAAYVWRKKEFNDDSGEHPVTQLYVAMEELILFGVANPELFLHINRHQTGSRASLTKVQYEKLRCQVQLVAKSGLLKAGVRQSLDYIHSFCIGRIFTILQGASLSDSSWFVRKTLLPLLKKDVRRSKVDDETLHGETLHDDLLPKEDGDRKVSRLASELKENLGKLSVLDLPERTLLSKWLEQIASA